jgi:hypothetical protein
MPEYNAKKARENNTLTLTDVELPDGSSVDWVVPPFSKDTEDAYWDWARENEAAYVAARAASRANEPIKPVTKGWVWSRLLALAVKKVKVGEAVSPTVLVAEQIEREFDALTLEDLGTAVELFFLKRKLKGAELSRPSATTETPSPETTT